MQINTALPLSVVLLVLLWPIGGHAQTSALQLAGRTRVEIASTHTIASLSERTFEAWVRLPPIVRDHTLYSEDTASNNHFPIFVVRVGMTSITGGRMSLAVWRQGIWIQSATAMGVVPADRWVHLAWRVAPDSGPHFFVDGVPAPCDPAFCLGTNGFPQSGAPQGNSTLFAGASCVGPGYDRVFGFEGLIRDVRIWSVARTGAEIARDQINPPAGAPGLIARFPLDGNLTDVISGMSGPVCGPINFVPFTGFPTTGPVFDAQIDTNGILRLRLDHPATSIPNAPILVWMNTQLGQVPLGPFGSTQVAISFGPPLVTVADYSSTFGPPLAPTSQLDAQGSWSFAFPAAFLGYIYGFAPRQIYFDAYVVDYTAPNLLFYQHPLVSVQYPGF